MTARTLFVAVAMLAGCLPAGAGPAEDVSAGAAVAQRKCAPCHSGAGPAPALPEVARGQKGDPGALRDFLHAAHNSVAHPGAMPHPELSEPEIAEISAWFATLRGR